VAASASWEYSTIPIDFEVFKALTARLESQRDTHNGVLRRLLGLPAHEVTLVGPPDAPSRPWLAGGVLFQEGTEFRGRYKGKWVPARVDDAGLLLDGHHYRATRSTDGASGNVDARVKQRGFPSPACGQASSNGETTFKWR
jgi:hypothetical protein